MEVKEGKLLATDEEQKILDTQIQQGVEEALKKAGTLNPQRKGVIDPPATEPEEMQFEAKDGETPGQTRIRLAKAVQAVSGGGLAVEKAPKELRVFRWFDAKVKALYGNAGMDDFATIKALGSKKRTIGDQSAGSSPGSELVPDEFGTDLMVAIEQYSATTFCEQHTMTSDTKTLRAVNAKPIVYQVAEGVAPTKGAPTWTNPSLAAKAFAGLQIMTKEFFKDNNVDAYSKLVRLYAEALGGKRDLEMFVGSAFTGIFGSATPQTTTLVSTSITDITWRKLVDMHNSLSDGKKGGAARWAMHRTVWGYILGLTDDNNRPIVPNPYDSRGRVLFGDPVYLSEQITSTDAAATAFIAYGDFQWCAFGTRDQVEVNLFKEGTFASTNIGETRQLAMLIDERWAFVVGIPGNLAILKTAAA